MANKPDLKLVSDTGPKSIFINAEEVEAVQLMQLLGMTISHATAFARFVLNFPANESFMYQDVARSSDPNVYIQVLKGSIVIGKITDGGNGFEEYAEIHSKIDVPNSPLDRVVFPMDIKKNIFTVKAGANGAMVLMFKASNYRSSLALMPTLLPDSVKSQEKLFQLLVTKRAPKQGYTTEAAALFQIGFMLAKTISRVIRERDTPKIIWLFRKLKDMQHDFFTLNIRDKEDATSELNFYHELIASVFHKK